MGEQDWRDTADTADVGGQECRDTADLGEQEMTISSTLSIMPSNTGILVLIVFVILAGVLLYALYKKGDVRAVFSHGKTLLELEAKERNQARK